MRKKLKKFLYRFWKKGSENLTVMFIPHSEKKICSFQISNLFLISFFLSILVMAFLGSYFFVDRNKIEKEAFELNHSLIESTSDLEGIRNNILPLKDRTEELYRTTQKLLTILSNQKFKKIENSTNALGGPFEELSEESQKELMQGSIEENKEGIGDEYSIQEVGDLSVLDRRIQLIQQQLEGLEGLFEQYRKNLKNLPSLFPVFGGGYATSGFGLRRDPFTSKIALHTGLDIANISGTPVISTANGVVKSSGRTKGKGMFIVIQHAFGYSTEYLHLSSIYVQIGQRIEKGQVIGRLGNTGRSTGPHLHYEVRINGKAINPKPYIGLRQFSKLLE